MNNANLLNTISKYKRHGDGARIARIVNTQRREHGEKNISVAYVNAMLRNDRAMSKDVALIAAEYFRVQEQINQISKL